METVAYDIDLDRNPAWIYRTPERRLSIHASLSSFGCKVFNGAYKVKNFDKFKEICHDVWNHKNRDEDLLPFLEEHIVDQLRVTTCFENMMKGILLCNGVVIHKISNEPAFLDLHQQQKKRPIKMGEIFTEENLYKKEDGMVYCKGLTTQTINISTMLEKEQYVKMIDCPKDLLDAIREVNHERNSLHMLMKSGFVLSKELNRIDFLMKHVASTLKQMEAHNKSHTEFKIFNLSDGINIDPE